MITPDELRKCAVCVYLAADEGPANDISNHLKQAADTIEALEKWGREGVRIASDDNDEVFHGDLIARETAIVKWKQEARTLGLMEE